MTTRNFVTLTFVLIVLTLMSGLTVAPLNAATQTDIVGPPGSRLFGHDVRVLSNGNIVVTDPYYHEDATGDVGAVYLYDGATLELISTLTGTLSNGLGYVQMLANGNYLVIRGDGESGPASSIGAVAWCSGTTGCSGVMSAANSLVGTQVGDGIGYYVRTLSNGNYVVSAPFWDNGTLEDAGAVTWCSGTTGCVGTISGANSLVGNHPDDQVGSGVFTLSNGNYVVTSYAWSNDTAPNVGAVTWCNGTIGCVGVVTTTNSLVGSHPNDFVGETWLWTFPNGNYVVSSAFWSNDTAPNVGAVTWCSGVTGCIGVVTTTNSLVGSHVGDHVGRGGSQAGDWERDSGVTVLPNGNYVVKSMDWDNGAVTDAGAITWCSGTGSCVGVVTTTNSLVGNQTGELGYWVTALANGNYLVVSPYWANAGVVNAGAVTWCSGTSGCVGVVTPANSLVGTHANDFVGGEYSITELPNGNYVVNSVNWGNGTVMDVGAVTWCDGTTGCNGAVTPSNSLVGTHAGDAVGNGKLTVFSNGNYVVSSSYWDNGMVADAGAVTWCSGTTGCIGVVTPANSLVGTHVNDFVSWVTLLSNGNYVVLNPYWDNGMVADAGAVTWCRGTAGCTGVVTPINSLVGTHAYDLVGGDYSTTALHNGNYVVPSPGWDNGTVTNTGAVTWCSGTTGCTGVVSVTNSLVGIQAYDNVGSSTAELTNRNYAVESPEWDNGAVKDAGAVTWCSGTTTCLGTVSATNSLVGSQTDEWVGSGAVSSLPNGNTVVENPYWDNGAVVDAGAITWGEGVGDTVIGPIPVQNSVRGETAHGGSSMFFSFDDIYGHLIVSRPADNKVTVVYLAHLGLKIHLPLVMR